MDDLVIDSLSTLIKGTKKVLELRAKLPTTWPPKEVSIARRPPGV